MRTKSKAQEENDHSILKRLIPLERALRPASMATATIVLSCSPSCSPVAVTPPHAAAAAMSSSPGLPSPSLLFSSMGPSMVGGSRATPIPTDALTGFASASTLLPRVRSIGEVRSSSSIERLKLLEEYDSQSSGKITMQPKDLRDKEQRVPAFKIPRMLDERSSESIQGKSTHTAIVPPANSVENASILAPKKSRKKKSKDDEKQTTIRKTRITKPRATSSGKKVGGSTKKVKEVVSAPLRPPASTQEEDMRAKEEFRNLCLEKAIARRKEWTPSKDTAPNPSPSEDLENIDTSLANEPLIPRFGNLLGDFGLSEKERISFVACETTSHENNEAIVKKRKIELVHGIAAPRGSEKPKRCKSPKKKPQTVTEKATAPFALANTISPPSLLQYFGAPKAETVVTARDASDNPDTPVTVGPGLPLQKMTTSKPKTRKTKRPIQKQPILLSPESAAKNARNQELVFGTSSQLAREESPTFLKDLQQAMKESESTVELKQAPSKDYGFLDLPSAKSRSSNVRAIMASKSLWSAASRDLDGSLVEVEIVDLTNTPKPVPAKTERIGVLKIPEFLEPQLKGEDSSLSDVGEFIPLVPKPDLNNTTDLQQQPELVDFVMPRSVAEAALKNRPKSKSPVKKTSATKATTNQMPNYQGFTDLQLRKEVSAYRFKPIKNREAMIMLLEQCWKSKMSMALQEVPANVSIPPAGAEDTNTEALKKTSPPKKRERPTKVSDQVAATAEKADDVPPKKRRGRPKKDPTSTPPKRKRKTKAPLSEAVVTSADDDIYDSSPPTPSPPRRRSPPKSPGQLQLGQSLKASGTNGTKTIKVKDRALLLSQITKAVTTFPPTHDVKNLTWYEKILMYDPIVLEDLTVWLNTEGLGSVGEDDEVWPGLVKEWCEERSVCCLWRENLRGGARGRW